MHAAMPIAIIILGADASQTPHAVSPAGRQPVQRAPDGQPRLLGASLAALPSSARPRVSCASRLLERLDWQADTDPTLRMRHFRLAELPAAHSTTLARTPALFNRDVALSFVAATTADDFYYRNAEGDEVAFVAEGSGVLESEMGELDYRAGDYVVIPRGILHRWVPAATGSLLLVIESKPAPSGRRARYCNERGQFLEHSPYCERDIRRPESIERPRRGRAISVSSLSNTTCSREDRSTTIRLT